MEKYANRLIIVGGPKTGKILLAEWLQDQLGDVPIRKTDDLLPTDDWSDLSATVSTWFDEPPAWIVEGVATARALRKWLFRNGKGLPADVVFYLPTPREQLTPAQLNMMKGVRTVWFAVRPRLAGRGCIFIEGTAEKCLEKFCTP